MALSFGGTTFGLLVFGLGLALIHAVGDHAMVVTRILVAIAIVLAAAVLLIATLVLAPATPTSSETPSVYELL